MEKLLLEIISQMSQTKQPEFLKQVVELTHLRMKMVSILVL